MKHFKSLLWLYIKSPLIYTTSEMSSFGKISPKEELREKPSEDGTVISEDKANL